MGGAIVVSSALCGLDQRYLLGARFPVVRFEATHKEFVNFLRNTGNLAAHSTACALLAQTITPSLVAEDLRTG